MEDCYSETAQSVKRPSAATAMEAKTMNPVVHFEMPYDANMAKTSVTWMRK
jgi:hypothetical protein